MKIEYRESKGGEVLIHTMPKGFECNDIKGMLEIGFSESDIISHAKANIVVKAQGMLRPPKNGKARKSPLPKSVGEWVLMLKPRTPMTQAEKLEKLGMSKSELQALINNMK
jgi:hypothetical protein